MYIHWRTSGSSLVAELTRSVRIDGKVQRVTIRHLGSVDMKRSTPSDKEHANFAVGWYRKPWDSHAKARVRFWFNALDRLGEICRDASNELDWPTISALADALARRVPLPTPQETAWYTHYYATDDALNDQARLDQARARIAAAAAAGVLPDGVSFMEDLHADKIFPSLARRMREVRGYALLLQLPAHLATV